MDDRVLSEALRLHAQGYGVLWLKPRSKAPVRPKWTTGPRDTLEVLRRAYRPGYNVGVRLGAASQVAGGYLAVLDVDVKSSDPRHEAEATAAVKELFPALMSAPTVLSGRGNGSKHLHFITPTPAAPTRVRASQERIRVLMPSAGISREARAVFTVEELNLGWRIRPAWEIAVMGEGQQVVLPPSVHPDSGKEYAWLQRNGVKLPLLDLSGKLKKASREQILDFKVERADLVGSSLSSEIVDLVFSGECEDRSAALFKVVIAMVKEGWTDGAIMSCLTDPNHSLALACYDHARTESRARAADWLYNYTIKKVRSELSAANDFASEVVVSSLSPAEAEEQEIELITPKDWRLHIERTKEGLPKHNLKNVVLILKNEIAPDLVRRDIFAYRDFYNYDTPWRGKKGAALTDDDVTEIKYWLSCRHRFEPSNALIADALTLIARYNSFDPVRDWLEALPEWDGVDRLDTWLARHFEAEGEAEYLAQVFRKWMAAMVVRIYEPGAKFDWMPIFEGAQGIGKSSFGKILVGSKYFLDWLPNLADKDSALGLQGAWGVEMGELASLRKTEIEVVKGFLSRQVDKFRPPYGQRLIESPRRCVFFGTTNRDTYLRDDSGNRRFKPVKVGQLNFKALEREREQLFAEALFLYRHGVERERTLELSGAAKIYEAQVHEEKTVEDESTIMGEALQKFQIEQNKKPETERFCFHKFKLSELFEGVGTPLPSWKFDSYTTQLAAKALKKLGAKRRSIGGYNYWKWDPPPHHG